MPDQEGDDMPDQPDRPNGSYPIIEERPLGPIRRRLMSGLRRDADELPVQQAGTRLVFRVNDRYEMLVGHRAIRGNEPTVVEAMSVAVIDVGRDRPVLARVELPSASPADVFVISVTFLCTVEDPVRVAEQGVRDPAEYLSAYIDREIRMLGHRFGVEGINDLRQAVGAQIMAACEVRPPRLEGIGARLGRIEVQAPDPLVLHEIQKRNRSWDDERAWQDKTLAQRHAEWDQVAKSELERKQRELDHLQAEMEQLRAQQLDRQATVFGYEQNELKQVGDQKLERRATLFSQDQEELKQASEQRLQQAHGEAVVELTRQVQRVTEGGPAAMDAMAKALGELGMREVVDRAIEREQRADDRTDARTERELDREAAQDERQWKREQADKDRVEAARERADRIALEEKRLEVAGEERAWQRSQIDMDRETENARLQAELMRGFVDHGLLDRAPLDANPVIAKALDSVFGSGTLGGSPDDQAADKPPKELPEPEAADKPADPAPGEPPNDAPSDPPVDEEAL
jgi:hypothetical protein